jgi:hypothetical protein
LQFLTSTSIGVTSFIGGGHEFSESLRTLSKNGFYGTDGCGKGHFLVAPIYPGQAAG